MRASLHQPRRHRAPLVWALLLVALLPARAPAEWSVDSEFARFHTTDLFPTVSDRYSDWGTRLDLDVRAQQDPGRISRFGARASASFERYDRNGARNLSAYGIAARAHRGPSWAELYFRFVPRELSFPATGTPGAILDRRGVGMDLRIPVSRAWMAMLRMDFEIKDFDTAFDERDAHRWYLRSGLQWRSLPGLRVRLWHEYRKNTSVTNLHTYEHNALRAQIISALARRTSIEFRARLGLRNYRTGQPFAGNFARRDTRRFLAFSLRRQVHEGLTVKGFVQWKTRNSTINRKSYDQTVVGMAVQGGW